MKKFIPFLSIMIGSVLSQSCVQRDEDIISTNNEKFEIKNNLQMRYDSAKTAQQIIDPDPPVRDGDNWRIKPSN
ncbi:hypothetical protein B0A69_02850 [Chryseobacterium shigense]|uniref:Lipoprotein n=1 Tax=Chryseobacterium shigense TaxID=297244 RepID=A0A1N7I849_9FLAO|nr:hypothetical protein [Chryseobacterium shigense]PQA97003.1 hypothetical protein B0A69_02850 [Chryseobacterium shigense]SIS33241.1 hypothetical protein SAMN05421639_102561 [Chryseobacterium shigense]